MSCSASLLLLTWFPSKQLLNAMMKMLFFFWRDSNLGPQNGTVFFVFTQKNIVLRRDLLPLPQKGLPAERVLPYCPSIPQGCPLCCETWELPLWVPPLPEASPSPWLDLSAGSQHPRSLSVEPRTSRRGSKQKRPFHIYHHFPL